LVQVHGFSCVGDILINKEGALVYPVAALIVVNTPSSEPNPDPTNKDPANQHREQRFFDKHDNAVVSHDGFCAVCY
jgi:hypothetical protein